MRLKKNSIKTAIMLRLRKAGYLCKKPTVIKRIRVSKTVWPDGTETHYTEPLKSQPLNKDSFASEMHVYKEYKKDWDKKIKSVKSNKK